MAVYKDCYVIIFGGLFEITRELNDLWAFNVGTNEWIRLFKTTNDDQLGQTQRSETLKSKKTRRDDSPENATGSATIKSQITRS